jgi:lysophospholipase L1-like esterase
VLADNVEYAFIELNPSLKIPESGTMKTVFRIPVILFALCSIFLVNALAAEESFELPSVEDEADLPGEGALRRYDGYVNKWQSLRSEWSQRIEADQNAVVFLGDSITQGWGKDFKGMFPDIKTANRGIGGDTTRGMLIRLKKDVLSLNPRAIVILMGTNDIEVGVEPAAIGRNFDKILAAIQEHSTEIPIVLCRVFPSSAEKKRPSSIIQQVNARYENTLFEAAMKGDSQVTVLDTWTLFANESGDANPLWFRDLLHLNAEGYQKWGTSLSLIFATLGYTETEPEPFELEKGYRRLFNGKDLTGWGVLVTPPKKNAKRPKLIFVEHKKDVSFDGKTKSDDGRYAAINGRLVVTTPPGGRRIQQLWTTESFDYDFVLKLEFRAAPYGDSGLFLRKKQLQVRDYVTAGPFEDLKEYRPQDWNEIVVTVKGGIAHATCNGELLDDNFEIPATGPIGLEGDRGQVEYRRIRLKRLP